MTPEEKYTHGCEHGDGESCYELALIYEQREKEMSAEMAFYEACDLGWEPACERISGAGAKKGGADEAGAKEDEEPGPPAKKSTLPPEVGAAVREAPSLKKSEIQAAIKEQMPKIKSCFTKQSVESGNVSVRITIDGKGEVTGSSVKHSSVDDEAVTKCLLMQVDMIEFPATPDGEPFTFSYPFTYMK
jgi:hypothetical protein